VHSIVGHGRARLRLTLVLACGIALLATAACELPEMPEWDVGIVAPFSSDPIGLADFLPGIVRVDSAQDPWVFSVDPQSGSEVFDYTDLCVLFCALLIGQEIPGFATVDSFDVQFSAELVSIEGASTVMTLHFDNDLGFEPLRSNPDTTGYIAIAIRDLATGTTVDSVFLSAATESLGGQRDTVFAFSGADFTDGVRILFWIVSPSDGSVFTITPGTATFTLGATLDQLEVAAATVVVNAAAMDTTFRAEIDEGVREEMLDRVLSGSYELKLVHDLELDGALEISIAGSEVDLFSGDPQREVRLASLVFTPNVAQTGDLTMDELEMIAGFDEIHIGYSGTAWGTGPGNQSRFTASQTLQTQLKVFAQIRIGE
jgi:hypothetical protein